APWPWQSSFDGSSCVTVFRIQLLRGQVPCIIPRRLGIGGSMNPLAPASRRVSLSRPALLLGSLALGLITTGTALAQSLVAPCYQANGAVRAVAVSGSTIYIGGSFTGLEVPSGGALAVDGTSASPVFLPRVVGTVNTIVPDGSGG